MQNKNTQNEVLIGESDSTAGLGAWISVNESRPEKMCHVLCACEGGNVATSFYDPHENLDELGRGRKAYGKYGRYFDLCKLGYKVTFWMPLPEAPNVVILGLSRSDSPA